MIRVISLAIIRNRFSWCNKSIEKHHQFLSEQKVCKRFTTKYLQVSSLKGNVETLQKMIQLEWYQKKICYVLVQNFTGVR